jgi:tetratricopeptide (TPR) repeat protein
LSKALEDFDRSITLDPSFSVAFLGRGETYVIMGEYARAIDDFGEAISASRDVRSLGQSRSSVEAPPLPSLTLSSHSP